MNWLYQFFFNSLSKSSRRLEFVNQGREGEVIYHEGLREIRFYMEFGGNDVVFYLSVPSILEWEDVIGFSLKVRNEILIYVATETQKYQAPSCDYKIEDTVILFVKK